jgi:ABC-type multidrug transport system permease subunit
MNSPTDLGPPARRYSALGQLVLTSLREFVREPLALFWAFGFPLLLAVALGFAFRSKTAEQIRVDVEESPLAQPVVAALAQQEKFLVQVQDRASCSLRLRTGKVDLVVAIIPTAEGARYQYFYDPTRPEGAGARAAVDDALQRAAGRRDRVPVGDQPMQEPGSRYIDFLVPGLLGMNLMNGGLLNISFGMVDMRVRKLLKRFLASPMKKSSFLASILLSRLLFLVPEVLVLLGFARLVFGVVNQGSLMAVVVLVLVGAFTFAGLGLLLGSRARTLEAASGLTNLVTLPMWIVCGIFFSSERFPEMVQPLIKLLPLTPLIEALRKVMLEGASLTSQTQEIGLLLAWGLGSFALALWAFRWS